MRVESLVPGAARLQLADGVPLLRPEDQVFTAMLASWRNQQLARNLSLATIAARLDPGPHRGHPVVDEQTEIVEDLRHPRQPHPARHAEQHA